MLESTFDMLANEVGRLEQNAENTKSSIRVCMPAEITKFNSDEMTVSARVLIKEKVLTSVNSYIDIEIPEISDIPVVFPGGSDFCMTYPINVGDECLLFFADTCIDSWWQSGGLQSQFEMRRHDLSDCFALICQMSQPMKVPKNLYSSSSLKIISRQGTANVEVKKNNVEINGIDIDNLNDRLVALESAFNRHTHPYSVVGVEAGESTISGSTGTQQS